MTVLSTQLQQAMFEEYPVGTVRTRSDGDYKKVRRGLWMRVKQGAERRLHGTVMAAKGPDEVRVVGVDPESSAKRTAEESAKLPGTISAVDKLVKAGHLAAGMTTKDHVDLAKKEILGQHAAMVPLLKTLKRLAPNGKVGGRTKALESVLGKLVRKHHKEKADGSYDMSKPSLQKASDLGDITGTRIVHDSVADVYATAKRIAEHYGDRVKQFEDKIKEPMSSGYRSIHFDIEDEDGKRKEVQVRTQNQQRWADWNHDFYKPVKPSQANWKASAGDVTKAFDDYAQQMSKHFMALDSGKKSESPDCPPVVKSSPFGCL